MADTTLRQAFSNIAGAIRAKGVTGTMTPLEMPTKISQIVVMSRSAFGLVAKEANSTITLTKTGSPYPIDLQYSTDGGNTFSTYTIGDTITLSSIGDEVMFRAGQKANVMFGRGSSDYYQFVMTGKFAVKNNTSLYSLISSTDTPNVLPYYGFINLFLGCSSLESIDISDIKFGQYSFYTTFKNCTGITSVSLPTLTSFDYGYELYYAFEGGSAIVEADLSSLVSVAGNSISGTFQNCTSLKRVYLTKLSSGQIYRTFNGCSSLELVDFSEATAVPTLSNTNAFSGTNETFKIVVPDALYSSWTTASNWANFASHIVKASEYTPAS